MINKLVLLFISIAFFSCGNTQGVQDNLVFQKGTKKVVLNINNGDRFLKYDTPTKAEFILTKIEPRDFAVMGMGIRVRGMDKGKMLAEINVPNGELENDTLNIIVRYKVGNDYETGKLYVPIKKSK